MNQSSREHPAYGEFCISRPPTLSQSMARRHWRLLNRMFYSIIVIHEAARYRKPLEPIVETCRDILSARCGELYVRSRRGASVSLRARAGVDGPGRPPDGTVTRLALAALFHNKPILIGRDCAAGPANDLLFSGSNSVLAAPIRAQGVPWGVAVLWSDRTLSQDEAVLMWIYTMMVESSLPAFSSATRDARTRVSGPGEEEPAAVSVIDLDLVRSFLSGDTCSLLRLGLRPADVAVSLSANADAIRVIRSSLRPVDRMMTCEDGDLVIVLPATNGSQAWAQARSLRRSLLQSRCLGDSGTAQREFRIASVTSPIDGGGPVELVRLLAARLEAAGVDERPASSVVAWKWSPP